MSDAWEDYRVVRRTSRRQKVGKQGRWRLGGGRCWCSWRVARGPEPVSFAGNFQSRASAFRRHGTNGDSLAAAALVIYNENDPLSRDLAAFYADKRGIPAERVVPLKCPTEEEISRQQYDDTIAGPLRAMFDARAAGGRAPPTSRTPSRRASSAATASAFLVLMRGMPLRIRHTAEPYPGDISANCPRRSGTPTARAWTRNSRCWACSRTASRGSCPTRITSRSTVSSDRHAPGMMLTGRLDAPTGSTVRQMILDSLAAEKSGLWGRCYLDGRGLAPEVRTHGRGRPVDRPDRCRPRAVFPADGRRPPERDVSRGVPDEARRRCISAGTARTWPDRSRGRISISCPERWRSTSILSARQACATRFHYWVGPLVEQGRGGGVG